MNMENVFIGEIRLFALEWAPEGWLACDGAELQVRDHMVLFSIIGKRFGGDGMRTFRVPDLRDRAPVGTGFSSAGGTGYRLADRGGAIAVELGEAEAPAHTHQLRGNTGSGNASDPAGRVFARERTNRDVYRSPGEQPVAMAAEAIGESGGGKPHDNLMPSLGLWAFIAEHGEYPVPG